MSGCYYIIVKLNFAFFYQRSLCTSRVTLSLPSVRPPARSATRRVLREGGLVFLSAPHPQARRGPCDAIWYSIVSKF